MLFEMEYGSPALRRVHVHGFDIVFETLQQVAYKLGTAIPHARKEIENGAPIQPPAPKFSILRGLVASKGVEKLLTKTFQILSWFALTAVNPLRGVLAKRKHTEYRFPSKTFFGQTKSSTIPRLLTADETRGHSSPTHHSP